MKTRIVTETSIDEAALCLKNGGTVVFPTETVYGLGADAFSADAVDKIYRAKGRPKDNPLIVHISHISDLDKLASEITPNGKKLIDAFWPGPLTLIFPKSSSVIGRITAGLDTVAVRFPSNTIAQELIRKSETLIAAPSANLSGSPSPTICSDVIDDLDGRVDYIIDGTGCEIGLESTVVDVSTSETIVLRPGGITLEMIREIIPDARLDKGLIDSDAVPKCPGLKYKHYSPNAKVTVVQGKKEDVRNCICELLKASDNAGVLTYRGGVYDGAKIVIDAGGDMSEYAHNLFASLRSFDKHGVDVIFAEFAVEDGMGVAVRNRLYKSAGHNIIEV